MTLRRTKGFLTATALILLFLSGCAPGWPTRTQVAMPPRPSPEIHPPAKTPIDPVRVEGRIQALEAILSSEEFLDHERRGEARALLEDYLNILKELRSPGTSPDGRGTVAILFERLGALEARYFETRRVEAAPARPTVHLAAPKENKIRAAYNSGDYAGVIQAYLDLESIYGPEALSPETGLLFAMALAESGKIREAIRVGERVLPELEGRPDLMQLRSRMVAWHQGQGNSRQARDHYEKLVDDVRELRSVLDPAERALEPSVAHAPPRHRPDAPPEAPVVRDSGPLGDLLHRVDTLIQSQAFHQARLLLVRQRIRYPEGPETAAIDRAMDKVNMAEDALDLRIPKDPSPLQPQVDEALDEARDLMEGEDYEKALARLEGLRGSPGETDSRVEALRQRAESELVRSGREKAAKLFLMARNAQSSKEKETHLRASHGLLSDLLERFPKSALASKIRSNLDAVEDEMARIGLPRASRDRRE